ncbi:2Fe-2S iron-sulfur cluster-binding protein [Proteiniphilum sp.]|uniref:2Fe-2S iron-sulfur cluster-binding protein n=1 Tax=Proteiniphilum sp. TaxID=1926877 RepID=UPI002B1F5976|nr:2Fe-2S iron-sulfur cluster-binding protein [Proteiniphilum sp.]MEA4918723.1 2Fe-2S iron-sulfur cluster-binding protein [Proteiniphilum sp.]
MKITIDEQIIEVEPGTTVLQAARMIGGPSVPPTMCYYSKLEDCGGKCRCCLVEVTKGSERDPRPMPKLQPSCVTAVQDGMEVLSANSPRALAARKAVTEFLLINHPLDCPVCDQAGECDLQDLAMTNDNFASRFREQKVTFPNEDIGPYISLNKNRCILCYRCVKLAEQLTPERVQGVLYRGDHAEISTYITNAIDNEFSGNMIDVCPVGALTDRTFRFQSRVWFTKKFDAHRDCPHCSGKVVLWMFGNEVQRVTAPKDQFKEVEHYICNECRFDHKRKEDWVIEGPHRFGNYSVLNINKNELVNPAEVVIDTDKLTLEGRDKDRKKISMKHVPLPHENEEIDSMVNYEQDSEK